MRILINGLAVFQGGSQTYFTNFIPQLGRLGLEHEFVLLHSPWQEVFNFELPPNFTRLVAGPRQRSVPQRVLWEQIKLPIILRQENINVMFSPTPATTIFSPCPTAIAVRNPNIFATLKVKNRRYQSRNRMLRVITQLTVKKASAVIFVSDYSRQIALKNLNFNPDKALVIYHGTGQLFFKTTNTTTAKYIQTPRPYILTVSMIGEHKNYARMIDAFARLCQEPDLGYDYVFAGNIDSQIEFQKIQDRIQNYGLQDRIHYLGKVPYQQLPALYQQASLFVLPSLLETFGHPLVEAMASGTPIATSNVASMPEICQNAAVYFDPYNIDDMANTLHRTLLNKQLQEQLILAGRQRVMDFSWEKTAKKMLELFEMVSESNDK